MALQEIYVPKHLADYRSGAHWNGIRGLFAALHVRAMRAGYSRIDEAFTDLGKQSAATVQKTFEELVAYTVARIGDLRDKADISTSDPSFSGGCAQNCLTNAQTVENSRFTDLFITASRDDSGLSIGVALYVYHHILGHRSRLADPRPRQNWDRVNEVKQREWWRPFAPACLSERLRDHFDGGPEHSPHMLFNYQVTDKRLAAVTHVDGSARAQTVGRDAGKIRSVIGAFGRLRGFPSFSTPR